MTYFTLCLTPQCIMWFYCNFFTISVKALFNHRHLSVRLTGLQCLSDFIILIWGMRNVQNIIGRAIWQFLIFSIGSDNGLTPNRSQVIIISRSQRICWGVILVSLRPSVQLSGRPSARPARIPCPLCSAYSSGLIHFIFTHLIKQFQKVYRL